MFSRKNKLIICALVCLMLIAFCAIGASAEDETPSVPIDPPDVVAVSLKEMPYKLQYIVGEKLDMTLDEFWALQDEMSKGTSRIEGTPFSKLDAKIINDFSELQY